MSGFFHHLHQRRCLNTNPPKKGRRNSLCVYISNPVCRNTLRVVWVVVFLQKISFLSFLFEKKIEKNKRENREGCWEWSHVTDVGKMRIFHRTTDFFLLMNCYLCLWWSKLILSYLLVIFSLSLCYFRLLLWVLAAAFITATVDVSIRYYTRIRMKKRPYASEAASHTVWPPRALFIIKCKSPWHTLTSPASFHSSNITDNYVGGFSFDFSTPGAAGWMAVWWVPLIVFLLFCFRRHRILIFGKTKPQIRLEDSTLDTGLGDPSSLLRWVKVEGSHHL